MTTDAGPTESQNPLFKLASQFTPQGDQPQAIVKICRALSNGDPHHILMGVTGSGKTFTMANVIARLGRPALVMAPNKTLAAQLFSEFKTLFPENAVEYFISYYDYYQPEAYVPSSDTYIAKDSSINDDIDKMRHSATRSLFERRDTIIIASVSCIYGLGSPESYSHLVVKLEQGQKIRRDQLLRSLIDIQYSRNDHTLVRGHFRVRGDTVDILPAHQRDEAVRVDFFGDEVDSLAMIDTLTGKIIRKVDEVAIYPSSHYVTDRKDMGAIIKEILKDLGHRLRELKAHGKLVEYQRLEQRTMHDIETLEHLGYCPGIENYSRYLTGVPPGHPPPTLLDYFPKDFLTIVDESHITIPQIGGMYRGDRNRKSVLVEFGFRLPSALDNRPLNFEEFLERAPQILHVSATPGPFELGICKGTYTEQIIRPTGLVDPRIEVRPAKGQVDDLYTTIKQAIQKKGRVLVTTLTKKMAEELTRYYMEMGLKVRYLHSDIDSLERVELLRDLRIGVFDILVGINLLREGLDLPEVNLVAVMDADKEGFLRSRSSLIQVVGRAARNSESQVIFYADKITDSMKACMEETDRRRSIQETYNKTHGITPQTIIKEIPEDLRKIYGLTSETDEAIEQETLARLKKLDIHSAEALDQLIRKKQKQMKEYAGQLEFEKAAEARDEITRLKDLLVNFGDFDSAISHVGNNQEPAQKDGVGLDSPAPSPISRNKKAKSRSKKS
jgi:excinuclease ABC subunit B